VDRIALGTAAIRNLAFLDKDEIRENANKLALSFDFSRADDDSIPVMMAGTGGWVEEVPIFDYRGLIDRIASAKIRYLNYTDRTKDGTLHGLSEKDIKSLERFLNEIKEKEVEVIYAGGISSINDIKNLAKLKNDKLTGIIVGKALYEENFKLKQAQQEADRITNVS
jgi:phosphoribosylformimino-5-aminoimidazole carboxamide ribotide isomerase